MRIETHAHTEFSQLRMLDCIVKVPQLIKQAASLGLSGVAITDHESVSGHVRFIQTIKSMKSSGELPEDFKGILGNEIYQKMGKSLVTLHFIIILFWLKMK